ncbi:MAG: hypothetical protein HY001_00010 [Candidatus Portnoybacteria bacterium]|nr:hypothetical protein [Candidatus Portnoybacteria bacterium]
MQFNRDQMQLAAKTFADLAKILFGSAVVGFFIPGFSGAVNIPTFLVGSLFAVSFFALSIIMLKSKIV